MTKPATRFRIFAVLALIIALAIVIPISGGPAAAPPAQDKPGPLAVAFLFEVLAELVLGHDPANERSQQNE